MSPRALAVAALGAMLLSVSCQKKDEPPALTDQDTPVTADFADEAASQIDKDNYKSELDKLATEIDKE